MTAYNTAFVTVRWREPAYSRFSNENRFKMAAGG